MVDPLVIPGSPYAVHLITPGDVLGLVTSPSRHHLGTPPNGSVRYGYSSATGFVVIPTGPGLRAGDVYMASVADWLAEALLSDAGLDDEAEAALQAAALVFDITPLGPFTVPAIAWTVPKQERRPVATLAHLSLVWNGTFDSPQGKEEVWSHSLACAMPAADQNVAALNTLADTLHLAWTQNIGPNLPASVHLREARVARVDANGHWERYADGQYKVGRWLGDLPAGHPGTVRYPLQAALCISLSSVRPGATGRGRFFVPWQGTALSERFTLTNDDQSRWTTAAKTFVQAVNEACGPVQIVSSKGYASVVTKVRVGAVVDTMRSRRNAQLESYREAAV